jgi:heme/copper-type cytochrome/quinol oxidase subunit 1
MFTVGIPHLALAFFSAGSAIVAVPTAIQFFAWLATLSHGRPRWDVPMLYIFGFFFVFTAGGLTGVMLAMVPFDWQAHDTYFVVAHLHYVVGGALAFPMLAAFYYWLPLLTGRTAVHKLSLPAFWLVFIGFNMTFFMMHLTGLLGMPRRVYTYADGMGWDSLNMITSVGSVVLAVGVLVLIVNVIKSLKSGAPAGANPWDAPTLEWSVPSPPPPYNFEVIPTIASRHPLWEDRLDESKARSSLGRGMELLKGKETIGTTSLDAVPDIILEMPEDTFAPLCLTIGMSLVFVGLLLKNWPAVWVGGFIVFVSIVDWLWPRRELREREPEVAGG